MPVAAGVDVSMGISLMKFRLNPGSKSQLKEGEVRNELSTGKKWYESPRGMRAKLSQYARSRSRSRSPRASHRSSAAKGSSNSKKQPYTIRIPKKSESKKKITKTKDAKQCPSEDDYNKIIENMVAEVKRREAEQPPTARDILRQTS